MPINDELMSAASAITSSLLLSEAQKAALLKLLTDEDPAVVAQVRTSILAHGPQAAHWLRTHRLSDDPLLRRRTQAIIRIFERQENDNRFLGFCLNPGQDFDLEKGAWLLAQTRYPTINVEAYRALLDQFAVAMAEKIDPSQRPKQLLVAFNQCFFGDFGFAGNEEDYYDPENSYLNRVIDRRKANPINLCLVYILLAHRLRLPVTGIGLPGHFVCRYQCSEAELYIDVFNHGKLLAKADCIQYLLQSNHNHTEEFLVPVNPRRILLRICGNLHQVYLHHDQADEATRFQRYLVALTK